MKGMDRVFLVCVLVGVVFAADPITVVAVGIGEKNSTFDEGKFPHISIYYTPTITATKQMMGEISFAGEPQFIVDWMNGPGEPNDFVLIGKNGVVYDQGKMITAGIEMGDVDTERRGELAKAVEAVTEKERTLRERSGDIDVSDEKGFVRNKLPSFTMTRPDGTECNSNAVFNQNEAMLVLFFYLDAAQYMGNEMDGGLTPRSKEYMRGRLESASAVESVRALIQVERELFDTPVHDIY